MKKLFFASIFFFILISCPRNDKIFIIDEQGNRVSINKKDKKDGLDYFQYKYDEKNRIKSIDYYDSKGIFKYRYNYDESLNLKSRIEFENNAEKNIVEYNDVGFKTKEIIIENSSDSKYFLYEYDKNGKVNIKKEYEVIDNLEKFLSYEEYIYDEKLGEKSKSIKYDENKNIKQAIEYNKQNIKQTVYNNKGNIDYIYEIDKDKNIESRTLFTENKKTTYIQNDLNSNKIFEIYYNELEIATKSVEMDKKGNKIRENYFDEKGNLKDYKTFEYDDKGKQIKRSDFNNDNKLKRYYKYIYNANGLIEKIQAFDANNKPIEYE